MTDSREAVLVARARVFAMIRHGDQRYGDRLYETHLRAVADLVAEAGGSDAQLAAAWLHDILEDTATTRDELAADFGHEVAALVWAVTSDGPTRAEKIAGVARKIEVTPGAGLIKLADRLANVTSCVATGRESLFARYQKEQAVLRPVFPAGELLSRLEELVATDLRSVARPSMGL